MPHWRVRDVMTTQVVTAREDMPVAGIAALLTGHGVSAVPIVDRFAVVVGVVSWADLQGEANLDGAGPGRAEVLLAHLAGGWPASSTLWSSSILMPRRHADQARSGQTS